MKSTHVLLTAICALTYQPQASPFQAIQNQSGGKLGAFALDTGTGKTLAYRADERFLMCSTFKLLVVAATLACVDAGNENLSNPVRYTEADLLEYAPVTRAHVKEGQLPVETLCEAAMEVSDNTAANLLTKRLGGPKAVTRFIRSLGDKVTRIDRLEPALNVSHGVLDTTTPRAMAQSLRQILLGNVLEPSSRQRVLTWMEECKSGLNRLRAGFPEEWEAGDKSGTASPFCNDIAIAFPPGRAPLIVAAFYRGSKLEAAQRERVLAKVGKAAVTLW